MNIMKRKSLAGAGAALILFIIIAANVVNGNSDFFNESFYSLIPPLINPHLTVLFIAVSNIGEWFVYTPVALLFLIIPRSRMKIGVPVSIAAVSSALLNEVLKKLFAVARPAINPLINAGGYGFPSGHAMNGLVFVGLCAYLFIKYSYKRPFKIAAVSVSLIFLLLTGFGRIYLGVHTIADVVGGYLMGAVILLTAIFFLGRNRNI